MGSKLRPVPLVAETRAYAVPQSLAPIDLRLDGNAGAHPPEWLFDELKRRGPEILRHYPSAKPLEELLSKSLSIEPEQVIVTAGGDDALDRACRAFLEPGREMILVQPTSETVKRYAGLAGATIVSVPWPLGALFPADAVCQKIGHQTAIIAVATPHNPSGAIATKEDLIRLSALAPSALLLVDLRYIEFADEDLTETVLSLPNAVAVRTFSKAWGLAGLRVGYAIGAAEVISWLRPAGAPYLMSAPSLLMAMLRLERDEGDQQQFVDRVRSERRQLADELRSLGVEAYSSQGNFVLACFSDAEWVRDALASLGIAVRLFSRRPELKSFLRISCPGRSKDFQRLVSALRAILSPSAVILDMDGVLADVSESYRRAIMETCKSYDVDLSRSEIKAAKALGNANNDWILTHRLLTTHGVETTLEEVTTRFEDLYQGSSERAGLRQSEQLIVSSVVIHKLAQTNTMAIVTGRPRADAERFLTEKQILDPFAYLVCMEDAPSKPDPAPVLLALRQLGVNSAWMVGDTPDDIRAARGAGVVPFGIVAPGDDPAEMTEILLRAGAARVLKSLEELKELIP
jgi:histidinol-phosphate aminotransferase